MTSFKAKTGRDRLRMREKKKSFQSIQTRPEIGNSKKDSKKIKKHYYDFFSCQNGTREAEDERKKTYQYDPFQHDPEQGIPEKQQKNSKK